MTLFQRLLTLSSLLFFSTAQCAEGVYGIVAGGFSDMEFETASEDGGSYKLGVGYQFDRQWYAEFGYQRLADASINSQLPGSVEEAQDWSGGLETDALYASILGKAAGDAGELFYRLGVLMTDSKGQLLSDEPDCPVGQATPVQIGTSNMQLCEFDEGGVAGVVGIGFDFYVGAATMVRAEIEYISGENGVQASAAYIGVRYNFL